MLPKHMFDRPPRISDFCSQVFTNQLFLSPPLTSPPRTHSFLYTLHTVDHPMRKLKVFCLHSKNTFFFSSYLSLQQNDLLSPNFSKFLSLTRKFTNILLKIDLNIYKKTTLKTHIVTNLRPFCEIDQKVLIFVEKLKEMQPL